MHDNHFCSCASSNFSQSVHMSMFNNSLMFLIWQHELATMDFDDCFGIQCSNKVSVGFTIVITSSKTCALFVCYVSDFRRAAFECPMNLELGIQKQQNSLLLLLF